jgi:tetratricopeptide (TPR) repeat protein
VSAARALAVALWMAAAPAFGQAGCGNFEESAATAGQIDTQFLGAVLRLQVKGGTSSGTGYLVSRQGYILTAAHVLGSASDGAMVDATSPARPGASLEAKIVRRAHAGTDLALLKLVDASLLDIVQPVDISLRFPYRDDKLYAINYPQIGDESNRSPKGQTVEFVATSADKLIEVKQSIAYPGASGGPLFNGSGNVIGTAVQAVGTGNGLARYVPMEQARELLDLIEMSDVVARLDEQVRKGGLDQATLAQRMIKRAGNPSNLDLYAWARRIVQRRSDYAALGKLLACPIIAAMMHRKLDDLVVELSPFAVAKDAADAYFQVARREVLMGRSLLAQAHAQAALGKYQEVRDKTGELHAKTLLAATQFDTGAIRLAKTNIDSVLVDVTALPPRESGQVFQLAGAIDAKEGAFAQAMSKFEKAVQAYLQGGNYSLAGDSTASMAAANVQWGKLTDAQKRYRNAIDLYDKAGNRSGKADALYGLARAQSSAGEKQETIAETFKKYLETAPAGPHAFEAMGYVRFKDKNM